MGVIRRRVRREDREAGGVTDENPIVEGGQLRQELIDAARKRLITEGLTVLDVAEWAEAEAARAGVGPLARRVEADGFDPMSEPFWSIPMTLAWIMQRNESVVREMWDLYRSEFDDWVYQEADPRLIRQRPPAGEIDLIALSPVADPLPFEKAVTALKRALLEGEIDATAVDVRGKRDSLNATQWIDLDLSDSDRGYVLKNRYTGQVFRDARLKRGRAIAMWPDASFHESTSVRRPVRGADLDRCARAYLNTEHPTQGAFWSYAKEEFPYNQVTKRGANMALENAGFRPLPGRPKKNKTE